VRILDRLKRNRQDDDDEDSQEVDEKSEDETSGRGGLRGRFGSLRGIGGSAAGMLGKVLKRGGGDGEDDEDGDEDETSGRVAAGSVPAVSTGSPGESLADFLSDAVVAKGPSDEEESDEDELRPLIGISPPAGTGAGPARVSVKSDIFSVRIAVDPSLKDLAMSQDAISAQELAGDLEAFVYQLSRKFSMK
jgi:hypothetical protein